MYLRAVEKAASKVLTMKELITELLRDYELKHKAREISKFAVKIVDDINRMPREEKEKITKVGKIDEYQILNEAKAFFEKELKAKIYIWKEEEKEKYDPKGKASIAAPYRPAVYLE